MFDGERPDATSLGFDALLHRVPLGTPPRQRICRPAKVLELANGDHDRAVWLGHLPTVRSLGRMGKRKKTFVADAQG